MRKLAVGIDLGGTNMRAGLVSSEGQVLAHRRRATPTAAGPEATAQGMAEMIRELRAEPVAAGGTWLGVGIGSPGPLSRAEKKIIRTPNLPGFDHFPIASRVGELTNLQAWLDNDAKCAAFGEHLFGAAKGSRNMVYLTFGTGVGGAVISDGRMIYGKGDNAAEIGHMTLYADGRPCNCNNHGCFEQYCSSTAISRRATERAGKATDTRHFFEAEARGEAWATELMKEIARDLSIATASLVNIFDPECVVFGGGVFTTGGGPLCALVTEGIRHRCWESSQKGLRVVAASLAADAGVLGAAALVFNG